MASGSADNPALGLYLRGELRGGKVQPGRDRPGPEGGKYPDRYHLSLAVGDDTYRVEYGDEAKARQAVETAAGGPASLGDVITLPVGARAGARGGADAFIFWYGVGERSEPELTW